MTGTENAPRRAAHQKQRRHHAGGEQQTPCQRAPGVAPVERHDRNAEAGGTADVDDGIGDHRGRHRLFRGRNEPNGRPSSIQ
jgi:hypothetical protein